ncbi:MAG: CPBP family intramembrane metalloprotease [Spirochaetaceae bacterium]|nr:MAG: CPBP family intramembrane metalloprotease [Spirochaetaceae bacterium]
MNHSIRNRSNVCKEILLVFTAFFLPGILFGGPGADPLAFERLEHHITVLVVALPQIGLIIYLLQLQPELALERYGIAPIRARDPLWAAATTLLLLLVLLLIAIPLSFLPGAQRALAEGFRWQFRRWEYVPLVLLTSVAVGYREELFFRGYLIGRLEDAGLSQTAALGLSTILFGLGHLYQGATGALATATIGLVLGIVFLRRRNLHVVALAHALYNTLVLTVGTVLRDLPT